MSCAATTKPKFCKSPTVAALLGLEFSKFTRPAFSVLSGFTTGVCASTLGLGSPFSRSLALYQLPSLPFSRISPALFLVDNGLATGVGSFPLFSSAVFGAPLGFTSAALYHLPSFANFTSSAGLNVSAPFATLPNCVGVVVWLFGAPAVLATLGLTILDFNGFFAVSIG